MKTTPQWHALCYESTRTGFYSTLFLNIIVILAMFSLFVPAALLDLSKDQIMLCEDRSANVTASSTNPIEKLNFFSDNNILKLQNL